MNQLPVFRYTQRICIGRDEPDDECYSPGQAGFNQEPVIGGILLEMIQDYSGKRGKEKALMSKEQLYPGQLPQNIQLVECPAHKKSISKHAPESAGASPTSEWYNRQINLIKLECIFQNMTLVENITTELILVTIVIFGVVIYFLLAKLYGLAKLYVWLQERKEQ